MSFEEDADLLDRLEAARNLPKLNVWCFDECVWLDALLEDSTLLLLSPQMRMLLMGCWVFLLCSPLEKATWRSWEVCMSKI